MLGSGLPDSRSHLIRGTSGFDPHPAELPSPCVTGNDTSAVFTESTSSGSTSRKLGYFRLCLEGNCKKHKRELQKKQDESGPEHKAGGVHRASSLSWLDFRRDHRS